MPSSYILRFKIDNDKKASVSHALGITPTLLFPYMELAIEESSSLFDNAINYFMDIIEDSIHKIESIGVEKNDITIWYLYEYTGQCNMEFRPKDLARMGKYGIALCISCWQRDIPISL